MHVIINAEYSNLIEAANEFGGFMDEEDWNYYNLPNFDETKDQLKRKLAEEFHREWDFFCRKIINVFKRNGLDGVKYMDMENKEFFDALYNACGTDNQNVNRLMSILNKCEKIMLSEMYRTQYNVEDSYTIRIKLPSMPN